MAQPHIQPPPLQRLTDGIARLGLSLPPDAPVRLLAYQAELQKWNLAYNLTAVRDPDEMLVRHLLDSLSLLPLLDELAARLSGGPRILDVGAGAGLPCIPLAIARPAWSLTGLDSNGKKARFMRHVQRSLGLANFAVIEGRVEAVPEGEGYDFVTSRAFASLADFFLLTDGLLAVDGIWIAMKGKLEGDELAAVPAGVDILETRPLRVPGLHEERHAVIAKPKKK
ncbi:MAG: 16S rRNA (guanine(527)-N(7))-methyltransferase RsmG [Nevskiaceae bacterium]|nr:MAG: 16S rRNA (guanine(527)-N(7))-methyltransferase RsmG [Nevskiaceae bacterium]TAM26272.1 MAG: 16S rRNA (guanine(527)-N(7))-methyltransferase RsmG [Nevskiaceae bacterium]